MLFLREHLRERLSLDMVCRHFNYSRAFLCRLFKEQTGQTIMSYFNTMKAEEAKRLLNSTAMSPGEISAFLGFRELKFFDEMFRKHTGFSPTGYRQQITHQKG